MLRNKSLWVFTIIFTVCTISFAPGVFAQVDDGSNSSYLTGAPDQANVDRVNRQIRSEGRRWIAQSNKMSRLPFEEKLRRLGASRNSELLAPSDKSGAVNQSATASITSPQPTAGSVPATFDWRNINGVNYVTPVRDQGSCGSCWAFSSTEALESQVLINYNNTVNSDVVLSPQILVTFEAGTYDSCSIGGSVSGAASYIKSAGLPIEACYPYTATDGSANGACAKYAVDTYKTSNWSWVNESGTTTPDVLKAAIQTYGPIVATFEVYEDFYSYSSGIYHHTSTSSGNTLLGGHAIEVVGWDDTNQCFIVKNSWGSDWGENGYFRIAYSELADVCQFGGQAIAYTAAAMNSSALPLADFYTASPAPINGVMAITGNSPLSVTFQDTSTTPNSTTNPISKWAWNFGDGTSSTAQNPSHSYSTAGKYTVSLTVSNLAGSDTATYTNMVTVAGGLLSAKFTATPTSGTAPVAVQFTDQSTGSVKTWAWTFGDGTTSNSQSPSHTYTKAGTYTATLTVYNSTGSSSSTSSTITVTQASAPIISLTATPVIGSRPLVVNFNCSASSAGGPVTSWKWTFGDGGTSTSQSTSHTYNTFGTYTATVSATGSSTVSKSVTVTVTPTLQASFTAPSSGYVPLTVQFNGSGSSGVISGYNWTFGDGTSGTGANVTHRYTTVGTYNASLTIHGTYGGSSTYSRTIAVKQAPSILAKIAATPAAGAPQTVSLSSAGSVGTIKSYSWNFGDGASASGGTTASHTYTKAGTYTAALTLTDIYNNTATARISIVVNAYLVVKISASATTGTAPFAVKFSGSGSSGPIDAYSWNFGDHYGTSGISPSHTYTNAGMYTASLYVFDANNHYVSKDITITVK